MRSQRHYYWAAFACGLVLALLPDGAARADEIVALVDEHGHKVYINTGEPLTRVEWTARGFRARPRGFSKLLPQEVDPLVRQTANRFQVDPHLVHAIIQVESEYDPNAVSRKGAMGLMQLVPATAQRFGLHATKALTDFRTPFPPSGLSHSEASVTTGMVPTAVRFRTPGPD